MSKQDRASLVAAVKAAEAGIAESLTAYHAALNTAADTVGRVMVKFAVSLFAGVEAKKALGLDQKAVQAWRDRQGTGFGSRKEDGSFGNLTPPSLYRYLNAGAVEAVLTASGVAIGDASYLSLVHLYRVLKAAEGKDEKDQEAARKQVVSLWKSARKSRTGTPTAEAVLTAVEAVAPPTRGKEGKDATGRKASQTAKNTRAKNTPTETTENDGKGNTETVTIDPAAVEATGKVIGAMIRKYVKEGQTEPVVRSIMLATIRLVREHGADTVAASLASAGK